MRMQARLVGWLLLALGLVALAVSIIYESHILAFIGLGLTFWGPLLLYISTEKYVKQTLLDSTVISSFADLGQILTELDYQGQGVYLPPKYFRDFETSKIFVSKNKNSNLPTPEEIQRQEDEIFLKNHEGVLITPPGFSLSKLFERTLGTRFTKVNLEYLQKNLPKLFVEDLEISENLEVQVKYSEVDKKIAADTIQVKVTNSVYEDVCKEVMKLSGISRAVGCPICSAIACALAKATGKPVIIETVELSADGKTIEADFRLLETIDYKGQTEALPTDGIESRLSRLLANLDSLFLTASGSAILAWIGWLTWYDITTWNKDLVLIFFGSRRGEAISLGIGMRVIYYLLIGLALLLLGLATFLRKRNKV